MLNLPCTAGHIKNSFAASFFQKFTNPLFVLGCSVLFVANVQFPYFSSFSICVLVRQTLSCHTKRPCSVDAINHSWPSNITSNCPLRFPRCFQWLNSHRLAAVAGINQLRRSLVSLHCTLICLHSLMFVSWSGARLFPAVQSSKGAGSQN